MRNGNAIMPLLHRQYQLNSPRLGPPFTAWVENRLLLRIALIGLMRPRSLKQRNGGTKENWGMLIVIILNRYGFVSCCFPLPARARSLTPTVSWRHLSPALTPLPDRSLTPTFSWWCVSTFLLVLIPLPANHRSLSLHYTWGVDQTIDVFSP